MKRRYRIMSDGTVYRVFPGGIIGSFAWPNMSSVIWSLKRSIPDPRFYPEQKWSSSNVEKV